MAPSDGIEPPIRPLTTSDIAAACALNAAIGWNQVAADWRMMLEQGQGYAIDDSTGRLIATAILLPYGASFAWISMVLVAPEHRRGGLATRLLRRCLEQARVRGLVPVLDATPAGQPIYRGLGFGEAWSITRLRRDTPSARSECGAPADITVRAIVDADWPALGAYDLPIFGADRTRLLRRLWQRLPTIGLIAERGSAITGYLLGRDGRTATQVGPLAAQDASIARSLLTHAFETVPQRLLIDLADHQAELRQWLDRLGWHAERSLVRMVYGRRAAFGDVARTFAIAGPELG